MARGPRPRGPESRRTWSPDLAYAVGLLATDGHLSNDGHHIALVSAEINQIETFSRILGLSNRIGTHRGGGFGSQAYRVQFGDRLFSDWLTSIGFTPRKTYTIGPLSIPDEFVRDFVRGHLDGDGSIVVYVDRYNTRVNRAYVYQRLYVHFISASRPHIDWLRSRIQAMRDVQGYVTAQMRPRSKVPLYTLRFAKKDAIKVLRWIYYSPDIPCLQRKRAIAERFLTGDIREFRHPPGFKVRERRSSYLNFAAC